MSTPMRHGPSQQGRTPQQHGAAPTPQASTPFSTSQNQAAFSPHGPRSSPQQMKKSPATSATVMGHPNSGTMNFDSPSAAAQATLGALGMNGNIDLNLDNISVGGLVGGLARVDEDERKKRMDAVIDILKNSGAGRVSNEGLERLARGIGLECLWEDGMGSAGSAKTLVIAGSVLALDIVIDNHVVQNVSLAISDAPASVETHTAKAGEILFRDLKLAPNQSPLTKRLDNFASNLERLARLDKLTALPNLNCFEAIAGIHESLEKLHQWDVSKARDDPLVKKKTDDALKINALCTRSGCPLMHARSGVGLSLDYWKQHRLVPTTTVDSDGLQTWSILIECAPMGGFPYPAVRVSNKWISDTVEKANPTDEEVISATGPILDWQEPESTLLPADEDTKMSTGIDHDPSLTGPKVPNVIFMATFEPPIIMTLGAASQIYGYSGTQMPESTITFDALYFPIAPGTMYDPSEPRTVTYSRTVRNYALKHTNDDKPVEKTHKNTLFIYKPVYGQTLTQVPFSHPRQLVEMMPLLRQYAMLSILLANSFKSKDGEPAPAEAKDEKSSTTTTAQDFQKFMLQKARPGRSADDSNGDAGPKPLSVDITLSIHPSPRLQIVFPFKSRTANILLEIQLGGRIKIVSDNVFEGDDVDAMDTDETQNKGKGKKYSPADWASMLELTEDIGAWCEYIKYKLE